MQKSSPMSETRSTAVTEPERLEEEEKIGALAHSLGLSQRACLHERGSPLYEAYQVGWLRSASELRKLANVTPFKKEPSK